MNLSARIPAGIGQVTSVPVFPAGWDSMPWTAPSQLKIMQISEDLHWDVTLPWASADVLIASSGFVWNDEWEALTAARNLVLVSDEVNQRAVNRRRMWDIIEHLDDTLFVDRAAALVDGQHRYFAVPKLLLSARHIGRVIKRLRD